ncbi:MAG TPA: DUF1269 domain-containing protein [Acidimicrobiales bacterium]|nr:DUF1269 domain-containing protein [Acidimicrobiales bacterium]
MNTVLIVTFDHLSQAREAMSELRRLDGEDAVTIRAAALVVREGDGRFWVPEDEERIGFVGTATGGAIGALLGALVGPVGLLFFGATGALVGSLADAEEADVSEEVLASVTGRVPPGTTAVVADVDEPSPRVVDSVMEASGGRVNRRPRADIEAEVAAAEEAMRAAQREAARVLRERRKAAGEPTVGDRLREIKEKITPGT